MLVEPNLERFIECDHNRPYSQVVHTAVSNTCIDKITLSHVVGENDVDTLSYTVAVPEHEARVCRESGRVVKVEVPCTTMDELLVNVTDKIDFVSIDVEGAEVDVLSSLDIEKYYPTVIEDNSKGKDTRVKNLHEDHGYVEKYRLEANVFYTKKDDAPQFHWYLFR